MGLLTVVCRCLPIANRGYVRTILDLLHSLYCGSGMCMSFFSLLTIIAIKYFLIFLANNINFSEYFNEIIHSLINISNTLNILCRLPLLQIFVQGWLLFVHQLCIGNILILMAVFFLFYHFFFLKVQVD